jgi:hypothetical protein
MSFPTSLDTLTDVVDNIDYPKAADINNLNTAVGALEAKVGVNNSAVSTSIDYIIKNNIWPVGSVFLSIVSTDPATLMGFGTWSQIAQGQMLIGQKATDADFNVAEETGGAKTVTIAQANLPNISTSAGTAHTHVQNGHTHTINDPGHRHNQAQTQVESGSGSTVADNSTTNEWTTATAGTGITINNATPTNQNESTHTHSLGGSGTAISVVNPYFVVYAWKRTA